MKKIKIFKSGFGEKLKLLLIPIGLLMGSINTAWATLSFNGANNGVKFSKSSNNGTNYYDHEIKHGTTNTTQDVGIVTNLYLKEYFVQLYQDEDNYTGTTHVFYWFYSTASGRPGGAATSYSGNWGDWGIWKDGKRYPKFGNNNISDDGGTTNVNLLYGKGAGEYTFEYYFNAECKNGWAPVFCSNGGGNFKATFTVPGFNSTSISKSFGTTIPVETESEMTIGFNHYGTALTTSNCAITGTNASMFTVRSINESGVTVSFSPGSSTGAKSAKLTITDAHSKRCEINLSATVVAKGTTTRLYFNDFINKDGFKSNSNWTADGALSRFTVQYTTGVYTHYPMTQCANSTYNYYADVEIKGATVSVDRYNPSSPYNTWNTASISGINTTNRYAQLDNFSDGTFYGFATNHPYNDVSGGLIYYDNLDSKITNTLYFIVGHDYKMEDGGALSTYSKTYSLTPISNTKLYYRSLSDTWHDADYYAVLGASSDPVGDHNWGSSLLGSKGTGGNTGIFRDILDLKTGNAYLGTSAGGGAGLSMTKNASTNASVTLNNTQTIKYSVSKNGGAYEELTIGNTPAEISISAYKFVSGTNDAVSNTSNSSSIDENQSSTYSTSVTAAYTGETSLDYDNLQTGYTYIGWFDAATGGDEITSPYYPRADQVVYARFQENMFSVAFDDDGNGSVAAPVTTPQTVGQVTGIAINASNNDGYHFDHWSSSTGGSFTSATTASTNFYPTAATTVTANFEPNVYDVTLNTYDGTINAGNVTSYTYGVGATLPTNVTKPGYDFAGWYDNEELVGDAVTAITSSDIDNKAYWAKWTEHTYTSGVLNKTTGSTAGAYSVTFHDNKIVVNTEPGKDGYHVDGYYLGYDPANGDYSNRVANQDGSLYTVDVTGYVESQTWVYAGIPTLYTKWEENTYSIKLMRNDGTDDYTTSTVTMGKNNYTPAISVPTRSGYDFDGYYTAASEGTQVIDEDGHKIGATYFDNDANWIYPDDATFHAHWTELPLTFNGNVLGHETEWSNTGNWSPACVPTSGHNVTINAETEISGSAVAKSVTIGDGGKVTIQPTGVLEVAGTVTNTDDSKLIINTDDDNQGALIYDIKTTAPHATVNLKTKNTGSGFQFIASPVGGVSVNPTFAGKGKYSYAWIEGKGWDQRGYYDAFGANEVIVLSGDISGCTFSGQLNPTTSHSITCMSPETEGYNANAQGVNMIPNTLTAPIKIKEMDLDDAYEGSVHIYNNGNWYHYAKGSCEEAVIPAFQGYAVITEIGGTVSFEYDAAVRGAATHDDALKAPKRTNSDIQDHITLSVTTNERKVDMKLYENEQFSNEMDKGWEALYMEGDGRFGELYAQAKEPMSILATDNLEGTVLGFAPGQAESYTISFEGDGKGYYLNDIKMEEATLIEEGNTYEFSRSDNDAARFIISRTPIQNLPTGVGDVNDGAQARKVIIDNKIYIIRGGRMYDTTGALVK